MKITITIEIDTEAAPSPEPVEKANTQTTLMEYEDLPWTDTDQEIIEAATVGELLKIQERVNSQIGQAKLNYGEGRKIHTCSRCNSPNRHFQTRLNGCLDCSRLGKFNVHGGE